METMSMHQEAAYRKLFRFVKAECAKFSSPVPEATPLVIQAIGALNDRPVLLRFFFFISFVFFFFILYFLISNFFFLLLVIVWKK